MNIQDYTAAAIRFDAHHEHWLMDALGHGLASEASEALEAAFGRDTAAFFAELGDVQWELALLAYHLEIPVESLEEAECERCPASVQTPSSLAIDLMVKAGAFSGLMEKRLRTNSDVTHEQIVSALLLTWQRLTWLAWLCGWPMTQVRQGNIDKLTNRYRGAA